MVMAKLTEGEMRYFLSLCKKIRANQDTYGYDRRIGLHVSNIYTEASIKSRYSLAYSLEKKGVVKISRKKIVELDAKGLELIQAFRNNKNT